MSKYLQRTGIAVPEEFEDPFYTIIDGFFTAIDNLMMATSCNHNIIIMGGGEFTFSDSTEVLSWTESIEFMDVATGYIESVVDGLITISDGYLLYIEVERVLTQSHTVTVQVSGSLGSSGGYIQADMEDKILIGIRRGDRIYFRNGVVLKSGETVEVFKDPQTTGGEGGVSSTIIVGD